jgi:catechol 2,3-dioxygenase-like lactoylglutathione lyase family enzyme
MNAQAVPEDGVWLEHAFFSVSDVERALQFYRKVFPRWVVRWEGDRTPGERWVHFGPPGEGQPGYLSLCEGATAPPSDAPYTSLRIQHVGFAHPDVDGLIARLGKDGIEVQERMDDGKYRRAYFEDPDGHELEFVQRLGTAAA